MGKIYARAARYALYPNMLGQCGPKGSDKERLYQYLTTTTKVDDHQARKLLEQFPAASTYMKLIAASNDIPDWLDPRVVEAYWIGSNLLDRVRVQDLKIVVSSFGGEIMPEEAAVALAIRIPYDAVPHHSFHVFIGSSADGKTGSVGNPEEFCRIGWGEVKLVSGRKVKILARSLVGRGGQYGLELSRELPREIARDPAILPRLHPGEFITFHWGRAVETITLEQARRLEHYTEATLAACRRMIRDAEAN